MGNKLERDEGVALPLAAMDSLKKPFLRQGPRSEKRGKSRPQHNPRLYGQSGEEWSERNLEIKANKSASQ